ncbi:MAG: hypothetical protein ABGX70_04905, partial [Psychrobacter sp.]
RLSAKGIEAEATISRLSTIMQPTLDSKIARADGIESTPSEPEACLVLGEERKKEESAIILYTLTNEKTRRL